MIWLYENKIGFTKLRYPTIFPRSLVLKNLPSGREYDLLYKPVALTVRPIALFSYRAKQNKHGSAIVKCLTDVDAHLMPVSNCQSVTKTGTETSVCMCVITITFDGLKTLDFIASAMQRR